MRLKHLKKAFRYYKLLKQQEEEQKIWREAARRVRYRASEVGWAHAWSSTKSKFADGVDKRNFIMPVFK